ncbi:serine/arginine repetitive matrix protein 1-like [Trichogramma pretiosum]|uniref:serine/arginine repetitive matrix protein 1-like n=1 Tax=Trichogramma pretiosum TaxID=7493 RepID=UPI0006C98AE7|nr:serine/arginine repetitive matrix protein 1-like [Trichogramma pretiosum]XP_014223191.1 serine/arginine repetitive matrix protein 1-like [Trichogramma pretiosum]
MELVATQVNESDGPYRNEDVHEWSRIDQDTGMHEKARVETGRWCNNTSDAAQSYGKIIDSRERNTVDGSLVQKARRQVEVFQSQATSGRCFQVVKASQWSSSRATDSGKGFDGALIKANQNNEMNGDFWHPSIADSTTDLEHLSDLCRRLHDEAIESTNKLWSLRGVKITPTSSATTLKTTTNSTPKNVKSNSIEDLPSLVLATADDAFARNSKNRRSLQVNSDRYYPSRNARSDDRRVGSIDERAKFYEDEANDGRDRRATVNATRRSQEDQRIFAPIRENDFVKNDPGHPSKFDRSSNGLPKYSSSQENGETTLSSLTNRANSATQTAATTTTQDLPRKVSNKTVVHLRNAASPTGPDTPPTRCINVTSVRVPKNLDNGVKLSDGGSLSSSSLSSSSSTSSVAENNKENLSIKPTTTNGTKKPVKKVEFCKTEIHFAPDSGKVNIVETDGKPPPTNKYRRKRRNNNGNALNGNAQKNNGNKPLVHFGDTSYERCILNGKLPPTSLSNGRNMSNGLDYNESNDVDNGIGGRHDRDEIDNFVERKSPEKSIAAAALRANGKPTSPTQLTSQEDNNASRTKGAHMTTVNLMMADKEGNNGQSNDKEPLAIRAPSPVQIIRSISPCPPSLHLRSSSPVIVRRRSPSPSPPRRRSPSPVRVISRGTSPISIRRRSSITRSSSHERIERSSSPAYMAPIDRAVSPAHAESHRRTGTTYVQTTTTRTTTPQGSPILVRRRSPSPAAVTRKTVSLKSALRSRSRSPVVVVDDHDRDEDVRVTYENVFSDPEDENVIVYENSGHPVRMDYKFSDPKGKLRKRWSSETRASAAKKTVLQFPKVVTTTIKRSLTPSRVKVKTVTESPTTKISSTSKLSRSQESLVKSEKVKVTKEKRGTGSRGVSTVREHKVVNTSNGGTLRSKKPVEVVYETAVYNMKNENLTKPKLVKTEIIRGPRLINDLICGNRFKRSADKKASVKTQTVSQRVTRCQ